MLLKLLSLLFRRLANVTQHHITWPFNNASTPATTSISNTSAATTTAPVAITTTGVGGSRQFASRAPSMVCIFFSFSLCLLIIFLLLDYAYSRNHNSAASNHHRSTATANTRDDKRRGLETICVSSPKYSMYFFSLFFFFSLFTNCIFTIRLRVQQESQQPGLPPLPTPGMTKERARDAGLGTATRHQHHQLQDRRSGSRVRVGGGEENRLKRMPDASVWALSTCFFFHLFFLY